MGHSVNDIQNLEIKKTDPGKVSLAYLKQLCDTYFIEFELKDKNEQALKGMYKHILKGINNKYELFEKFIKNYIIIGRVAALKNKGPSNLMTLNLHWMKDNISLFINAIGILEKTNGSTDYLKLARLLKEKGDYD
jgi:hypothetical protein